MPKAAARAIAIMMAILLFVDVIGINWSIFATNGRYVSGIFLGNPNLPIEEVFFLFLLCYFVLVLNTYLKKRLKNA
jgi:lycopene cyclase domain-containing protein